MVTTHLPPSSQRNVAPGACPRTSLPCSTAEDRLHRSPPPDPAIELPASWPLELGGTIDGGRLAYSLTGPDDGPVVVALGGISAHRRVDSWWPAQTGPGRALDNRRFRVLSFDYLGGNGDAPAPASTADGSTPAITTGDQARALARILDRLGVPRLHALVGASYGGMVGLAFAARFPERLRHLVAISAADRPQPLATGWRSVQRRIVRLGERSGDAREGVLLARALAMTTYRTAAELGERFDRPAERVGGRYRFAVESYLEARGKAFADSFDAGAFLRLSESLDLHRLDPGTVRVPTTLVAVKGDLLVPVAQIRRLAARLGGPVELVELDSLYGHDAFLKEHDAIAGILARVLAAPAPGDEEAGR